MSMPEQQPQSSNVNSDARWVFMRDVLVFEFKMFLDNLRDFLLMPASLIAAGIDLVLGGERHGRRFYKVLEWGKHSEEIINVYGCIDETPREHGMKQDYSVDAVVNRLEAVIVREYEKGGTAATIKSAIDRALDQLQGEAQARHEQAKDAFARAAEKIRANKDAGPGTDAGPA